MITSTCSVHLDGTGPVDVTVSEYGACLFLLLHGGGGPNTVASFGDTLAATEHVRVLRSGPSRFRRHPPPGGTAHGPGAWPRSTSRCWTSWAWTTSRSSGTRSAAGSPPRSPHPELTPRQPRHPRLRGRPGGPGPSRRRFLLADPGSGLRAQLPQPRPVPDRPRQHRPPSRRPIAAGNRAALSAYAGSGDVRSQPRGPPPGRDRTDPGGVG